jgi:N-methylhydantoinase A
VLNGFTLDTAVELVTLRVEASAGAPPSVPASVPAGTGASAVGQQVVQAASGALKAPVFDRATLGAGDHVGGPAIVTQLDATTLVAPGWHATVLGTGALVLRKA